jgi:tetratricopeptide (TPR) repeat protein
VLFIGVVVGTVAWYKTDGFRGLPQVRQVVDSQLATQLRKRDFGELEKRLGELHERYAADVRTEERLTFAYQEFEYVDSSLSGEFDRWVDAVPDSSHARIARAAHQFGLGWHARGSEYVAQTPIWKQIVMRYHFYRAERDLGRVLARDPGQVFAYAYLLEIRRHYGDRVGMRRLLEEGLAVAPLSVTLRRRYMTSLEPKWGGSIEAMRAFAAEGRSHYAANPDLQRFEGAADEYIGHELYHSEDVRGALAAYSDAINRGGGYWRYYYWRGRLLGEQQRFAEARPDLEKAFVARPNVDIAKWLGSVCWRLEDFACVVPPYAFVAARRPSDPESLAYLAEARARSGDLETALREAERALEISGGAQNYQELRDFILKRMEERRVAAK